MPTAAVESPMNKPLLMFPDGFEGIQAIHEVTGQKEQA
jgi:hypothetical protein